MQMKRHGEPPSTTVWLELNGSDVYDPDKPQGMARLGVERAKD